MSLLDDVSIVVTPNGYKAGELYAVVPVPTEGAEEVVDGNFPSPNVNWTKDANWTIANNLATSDGSQTGNVSLKQSNTLNNLTTGTTYKVQFTISGYVAGVVNPHLRGAQSGNVTGDGIKTSYITAGSGSDGINLYAGSTFEGSISNVSVKEALTVSADMDVTRATAATRVDEDGLVNYAEVIGDDLVTNGDFSTDSDWTKNASWTIANGKASYDGSGNGDRIKQNIPLTIGKKYTASLDILDSSGRFRMSVDGGSSSYSTYTTGNGTYTFEFTSSSVEFSIRGSMSDSANTFSIDNVSVKQVDRDNVPRIDYTGGGCPHILAEPQRTNLITYSEDFNSWYAQNYVTVTEDTNETTSPSGNNTASKITINSVSTIRRLYEVVITSSGNDYTFTLYAKKGTTDYIRFFLNSNIFDVTFDLTNGTKIVTTGSGSIESVGNDWYRLQATGTSSLTGEVPQIQLSNSASVNDYLYIWGAQFEESSYATSYIPTSGSTVTRNQDIFTRDGIGSLINSTEGVLFVEMAVLSADTINRYISLSNGTDDNSISFHFRNNTNNQVRVILKSGNVNQFDSTYNPSGSTAFAKVAFKYKVNDFALWVNGTEIATDTSGITFSADTLNRLAFDDGNGNSNFFGKVKQLQVYNTALTDAQLTSLTS